MNGQNEENFKELFEKFYTAEQAQRAIEDVQKAEQLLREHPAPEPDDMLIADIKAEITMRLPARRAGVFRRIAYKVAAVAAAIIVVAAIYLSFLQKADESEKAVYTSIIPPAIWESDDMITDDVDLATLTAEIEQIEDELLALQWGENGTNGDKVVTELEAELIEISSDFWKG